MGWYGNYIGYDLSLNEIKEEIVKLFTDKYSSVEYISFKFGEAYLALKHINTNEVFALVVLWRYNKDRGELTTKSMDETMGPYYHKPTAKLLKMLSPTDNKNALAWRYLCWQNFKRIPKDIAESFTVLTDSSSNT